jgi:predicted DNA binding CopG/RHH family protein
MEMKMQIQQRKKKQIKDIGYTIRLDEKLLDKVRDRANEKDMSVNLYINTVLMIEVEK